MIALRFIWHCIIVNAEKPLYQHTGILRPFSIKQPYQNRYKIFVICRFFKALFIHIDEIIYPSMYFDCCIFEERFVGYHAFGGQLKATLRSLNMCLQGCVSPACIAVDYNSTNSGCWHLNATNACTMLSKLPGITHYRKANCRKIVVDITSQP